jgi:hypothetical protein
MEKKQTGGRRGRCQPRRPFRSAQHHAQELGSPFPQRRGRTAECACEEYQLLFPHKSGPVRRGRPIPVVSCSLDMMRATWNYCESGPFFFKASRSQAAPGTTLLQRLRLSASPSPLSPWPTPPPWSARQSLAAVRPRRSLGPRIRTRTLFRRVRPTSAAVSRRRLGRGRGVAAAPRPRHWAARRRNDRVPQVARLLWSDVRCLRRG